MVEAYIERTGGRARIAMLSTTKHNSTTRSFGSARPPRSLKALCLRTRRIPTAPSPHCGRAQSNLEAAAGVRAVTWAPSMGVTSPFRILLRRFDPMGGAKSSPYRRPARRKTAPWPILRVGKPRRGVVRARQLRRAPGRRLVQAARTLVGVRWRPSYSACARALGCTGHCGGGDRGGCGTVVVPCLRSRRAARRVVDARLSKLFEAIPSVRS